MIAVQEVMTENFLLMPSIKKKKVFVDDVKMHMKDKRIELVQNVKDVLGTAKEK